MMKIYILIRIINIIFSYCTRIFYLDSRIRNDVKIHARIINYNIKCKLKKRGYNIALL